ncbi:gamma-glutamylputrescine oxidase [Amaricoccus macauensis]|uniref:Gamma-glutamylputrescine oxidase n=1 Tax=Amaricoccus macauensis TaxID=57001 RepID=A0A840SNV6_9RHOB|nr:FAD-binding oxidoreductase [Amaricoccus macauensis]MBB5222048.1 gamma-glutamylputrescine oxidase [Amaricoccus macauensis]
MPRLDLLTANDRPGSYPASWYAASTPLLPGFPPLAGTIDADVCVVGGGYTGLSAALHLAEAGFSVALIEASRVGSGASGRNGGQVHSGQRQDQGWLEARLGVAPARALWELAEEAKALVRGLIARHGIDCDLQDGIVAAAHRAAYVPEYHAAAEKLAREYGYGLVTPLDAGEIGALLGTDAYFGGTIDRGAAHLHPLAYALGLARAVVSAGVRIHETSRVTAIDPGDPSVVHTAAGSVRARYVVLATNGYVGDLVPAVAARVMPINNFIVATAPLDTPPLAEPVAVADSRFVVNYYRISSDGRLLFGGGESYGWRFPTDIGARVRPRLREIYPHLGDVALDYAWGGTLAITVNRMPAFQRLAPNVLSAAGYSGQGVATATLAGKLIAEAVGGTAARFDLFASIPQPAFPGGALLRWPALVLAMSWYAMRDRL